MDLQHGVLLLLIGLLVTFVVFCVIVYAEKPKEDQQKDLSEVEKSLRRLLSIKKF